MNVLAKILSRNHGDSNHDSAAMSQDIKAKLGITQTFVCPSVYSPTLGPGKLAEYRKICRVSRPKPLVTRPLSSHLCSRTVEEDGEIGDSPNLLVLMCMGFAPHT